MKYISLTFLSIILFSSFSVFSLPGDATYYYNEMEDYLYVSNDNSEIRNEETVLVLEEEQLQLFFDLMKENQIAEEGFPNVLLVSPGGGFGGGKSLLNTNYVDDTGIQGGGGGGPHKTLLASPGNGGGGGPYTIHL